MTMLARADLRRVTREHRAWARADRKWIRQADEQIERVKIDQLEFD